jgi:hypothetical protein
MSSTALSALTTETFSAPFGKVPTLICMTYRKPGNTPNQGEMKLGFDMLDALLKDLPFEQWEH